MNCPDEEEKFAQLCNVLLSELAANVSELPTLATFAKTFFFGPFLGCFPPKQPAKSCLIASCMDA